MYSTVLFYWALCCAVFFYMYVVPCLFVLRQTRARSLIVFNLYKLTMVSLHKNVFTSAIQRLQTLLVMCIEV